MSSHAHVRDAMEIQAQSLRQALMREGFDAARVNVSAQPQSGGAFSGSGARHGAASTSWTTPGGGAPPEGRAGAQQETAAGLAAAPQPSTDSLFDVSI
jgi:hypothetical protein